MLLPSAPVTCICPPLRAEMIPMTSGPLGKLVRSVGVSPVTVISLAPWTCSCTCAERPLQAGTAAAANSKGSVDRLRIFTGFAPWIDRLDALAIICPAAPVMA